MRSASALPEQLRSGPFSIEQASEAGLSRQRLRASDLTSPFQGVRVAGAAVTVGELCRAYQLRMTEGHVFSHETAAVLYGMPLTRALSTLTLHVSAAPDVFPPQSRGVIGHATSLARQFRLLDGLPVIEPAVALLQLAPRLSHRHLVRGGDFLLQRREPLCDWRELHAVADAAAGARGIRSFRRALDDVRAGTDSPRETDTRLALVESGLPEPVIGYRIVSARGLFLGTPDLAYPLQRVAIEYEGAYHREEEQFAYDIRRRELMEDAGWAVIRVISQHLATLWERSRLANRVRNTLSRQSRLLEL